MTALDAFRTDATTAEHASLFRPIAAIASAPSLRRTTPRSEARPATITGPTVVPRVQPSLERRRLWEKRYLRRLTATDLAVILVVTALSATLDILFTPTAGAQFWSVMRVTTITVVAWVVLLRLFQTRSTKILGAGAAEYKRVVQATSTTFGILAILFIAFEWDGIRMLLLVALPLGLAGLTLGRWSWRRWLVGKRAFGHYSSRVLIAGNSADVEYVIRNLSRHKNLGYIVAGVATLEDEGDILVVDGVSYPVLGAMSTVSMHAREVGADAIIVASTPQDDPDFIKRLSWDLEGTAAELILSGRLTDVAGPRISLRPVDGLPLLHVDIPRFEGGVHSIKRGMDIVFSALALIPVAMVTPFIALLIKLDDGGPVFFRQTRIGRDGREFGILKFRTMRVDAEAQLEKLRQQNEGAGLLFKMKSDPRVTRVGAILRKTSLDELPQFWNVLVGDMSVVGPRPPLPQEVTAYDGTVYRRLYIKPGITGLWQVSGRSDLSWEESVRLDLRYVENWSVVDDFMIMFRTAQVMLQPKGAY